MSTKKIKWSDSRAIGREIADKAFEHLLKPLEEQEKHFAWDAYNALLKELGVPPGVLVDCGFAERTTNIQIEVRNRNGQSFCVTCEADEPTLIRPTNWSHDEAKLESDELFDRFVERKAELNKLEGSRSALANELGEQLEGKTVKQAMNNWPEAADIISDVMRVGVPAMTTPLENLLARFLPMLAAPVGA